MKHQYNQHKKRRDNTTLLSASIQSKLGLISANNTSIGSCSHGLRGSNSRSSSHGLRGSNSRSMAGSRMMNRKEKRSENRIEKKFQKTQNYGKSFKSLGGSVSGFAPQDKQPATTLKGQLKSTSRTTSKVQSKVAPRTALKVPREHSKATFRSKQLESLQKNNPTFFNVLKQSNLIDVADLKRLGQSPDSEEENDLDAENIKALSKKLKLKDRKMNQSFKNDGLDYLLDGLEESKDGPEKDTLMGSSEEEDCESYCESLVESEVMNEMSEDEIQQDDISENELENDISKDEFEEDEFEEDEFEEDEFEEDEFEEDEMSNDEMSNDEMGKDEMSNDEMSSGQDEKKEPKKSQTYIPPHLRKKQENDSLRRPIQGLINRLGDPNMQTIVQGILSILQTSPRKLVTETVTEIVLQTICDKANLLDSFCATYACFIGSLYQCVGLEFGAHFVQTLVTRFQLARSKRVSHSSPSSSDNVESKECTNLAVFLAFLYTFKVVSCIILYDLIKQSISCLSEIDVEILLKMLKVCGQQLRADDPTALKDIIVLLQSEISNRGDSIKTSVRFKFMVETIMDLKNNKKKANALQVQGQVQMNMLKKIYASIVTKNATFSIEALRVGLDDIQQIESKGKWWLVGSAWKGNDNQDGDAVEKAKMSSSKENSEKVELLSLARAQNMNTDIRKSIFVIVMGSQDFMDAYEKLVKLGLKSKQQRDIVRVLFKCCQQEPLYNPYYMFILRHFCLAAHGYKITCQYTLWDFFKELDQLGKDDSKGIKRAMNMGRMIADLLYSEALHLSVLKTVEWTSPSPGQTYFLVTLFQTLLSKPFKKKGSEALFNRIFKSLADMSQLEGVSDGIVLFLSTQFGKADSEIRSRIKVVKSILNP